MRKYTEKLDPCPLISGNGEKEDNVYFNSGTHFDMPSKEKTKDEQWTARSLTHSLVSRVSTDSIQGIELSSENLLRGRWTCLEVDELVTCLLMYLCCIKIFHEAADSTAHVTCEEHLHILLSGLRRCYQALMCLTSRFCWGHRPPCGEMTAC